MSNRKVMSRLGWAALEAAVILVCFFSGLAALGLVGPDEPRYASVARGMAESGDWVTPRLDGEPWFEKPVLYYWAAAAAFRLLGVSEFSARLPSALAAALLALVLGRAAYRLYGEDTGRAVLLIFPTCVGVFAFARAATTDMLFSAFLGMAMLAASVLAGFPAGSRPQRYWLLVFGALLGLATLAKGPAAIVLAGGSTALWALATRKWKQAFRLAHPLAVAAWAAVALPWYVLCASRNPGFVDAFLISHNVQRYLTPVFRHEQPLWFYGPILLLGLLPWTALLAGAAADASQRLREKALRDSAGFFLGCWVVFPVLFFSFSKSKLPGYVLPVFAPLALLLARRLTRIESAGPGQRRLLAYVGATFLLLPALGVSWMLRLPPESGLLDAPLYLMCSAVTAGSGVLILVLGLMGKRRAALAVSAVVLAGLVEVITSQALPRLDPHLSARAATRAAIESQGPGETLQSYRLHRAWHYGMNFYLGRPLPLWTPESARPALLCTSREGLADLERQAIPVQLVRQFSRQAILVRVARHK